MIKCGNKKCACHRDPPKRHGPYFECTYKVQNKTVNLKLYPEMTPLYRDAIRQYRKLRLLLGRMERLSRSALAHLAQQKRSEEHTSELQSRLHLVCRLLLEKKKQQNINHEL